MRNHVRMQKKKKKKSIACPLLAPFTDTMAPRVECAVLVAHGLVSALPTPWTPVAPLDLPEIEAKWRKRGRWEMSRWHFSAQSTSTDSQTPGSFLSSHESHLRSIHAFCFEAIDFSHSNMQEIELFPPFYPASRSESQISSPIFLASVFQSYKTVAHCTGAIEIKTPDFNAPGINRSLGICRKNSPPNNASAFQSKICEPNHL
ncbi:hypothetical protein JOL62DRAFT_37693 [Phyllosticta paracitricarpa]|uniref:Uncharacterized protein n=1 Tax=Phyllosticta paracitricarpa TaxID=2016321 RepID=A0ABR1NAH0_9PEZI